MKPRIDILDSIYDYPLELQFVEKHRDADEIVVHEPTGIVIKAVYWNPAYRAITEIDDYWAKLRKRMAEHS